MWNTGNWMEVKLHYIYATVGTALRIKTLCCHETVILYRLWIGSFLLDTLLLIVGNDQTTCKPCESPLKASYSNVQICRLFASQSLELTTSRTNSKQCLVTSAPPGELRRDCYTASTKPPTTTLSLPSWSQLSVSSLSTKSTVSMTTSPRHYSHLFVVRLQSDRIKG